MSFILAMTLNQEVQKKAQAEVDRIVGSHRLPEFDDLDDMVYTRAVIMETLRWMTAIPLPVPHATSEDDVYEGYHIPKGAMIIAVSIADI